uniref:Fumarylacetoacetase-like C-terminal domain-containing protein n=1 Tax=Chromera velia CCMP2878 TaxID=1169474 RepID=A0A0G4F8Z8_9ALVE|eukprot:Cvel_15780.t1-p1 / transcript=Cvel_15780.t1 / gene=Cvel_15780 / organism=Chromera_velia_CCMP2878 / gene_product=Fumarylacetoacetate hydrolase domain-containing, putative / transcript_product=Fumarylacetoacetate hydrolase domain-containing, putative / location=Cvel_scaffold1184:264-836(+) / protein_length=191 / sequence_SO=supercontig / SO=protein_coding / is_pseudo=false
MQHPNDPIVIPQVASDPPEVDYECELAVVIGKACTNVPVERALEYVLGYTCANDVTARKWQGKRGGGQWCRSKCFDTFAPLGPALVPGGSVANPNDLSISTELNGKIMQKSTTGDMVFSVAELISFLSQDTTLLPGTVILTGTPEGVGFTRDPPVYLSAGDVVTINIGGIGSLTNVVVQADGGAKDNSSKL